MKTIRVLQVLDSLTYGGIQSFIMNMYRSIDRNRVQFDFLLHKRLDNAMELSAREMGAKLYFVTSRKESYCGNKVQLRQFFSEHPDYQIVHHHVSSLSYVEPLRAAAKANVPCRIIHSHSSMPPKGTAHAVLHAINQKKIMRLANHFFACSDFARDWLYGDALDSNLVEILRNGIDVQAFSFDGRARDRIRDKLELGASKVYGHVGSMSHAKNHEFLIDVFKAILSIDENSVLLLVGDGPLMNPVREKAKREGVFEKVRFLGLRDDINKILPAFDVFVFPSRFEGFPIALVEAQAIGLECIASNQITKTADLTGNVTWLDANDPLEWARAATKAQGLCLEDKKLASKKVRERGFDQRDIAVYLQNTYLELSCEI